MLSLQNVRAIARTHHKVTTDAAYIADLDQFKLRTVVRATAASLGKLSRGGLAPEVYLPASKVSAMLWTIYKAAKAQAKADIASYNSTVEHLERQRVACADDAESVAWIDDRIVSWKEAIAVLKQFA